MASFIIRRLIASIFVLFAATFLMYILTSLLGRSPRGAAGRAALPTRQQLIEARTKLLNLDVPPPLRYFLWLGALFRGDFGVSVQNQPVNVLLAQRDHVNADAGHHRHRRRDRPRPHRRHRLGAAPVQRLRLQRHAARRSCSSRCRSSGSRCCSSSTARSASTTGSPIRRSRYRSIIVISLVAGLLWMSLHRRHVRSAGCIVFGVSAVATAAVLTYLSVTEWFADPSIGIVVYSRARPSASPSASRRSRPACATAGRCTRRSSSRCSASRCTSR